MGDSFCTDFYGIRVQRVSLVRACDRRDAMPGARNGKEEEEEGVAGSGGGGGGGGERSHRRELRVWKVEIIIIKLLCGCSLSSWYYLQKKKRIDYKRYWGLDFLARLVLACRVSRRSLSLLDLWCVCARVVCVCVVPVVCGHVLCTVLCVVCVLPKLCVQRCLSFLFSLLGHQSISKSIKQPHKPDGAL